jgi:hypothetical protein
VSDVAAFFNLLEDFMQDSAPIHLLIAVQVQVQDQDQDQEQGRSHFVFDQTHVLQHLLYHVRNAQWCGYVLKAVQGKQDLCSVVHQWFLDILRSVYDDTPSAIKWLPPRRFWNGAKWTTTSTSSASIRGAEDTQILHDEDHDDGFQRSDGEEFKAMFLGGRKHRNTSDVEPVFSESVFRCLLQCALAWTVKTPPSLEQDAWKASMLMYVVTDLAGSFADPYTREFQRSMQPSVDLAVDLAGHGAKLFMPAVIDDHDHDHDHDHVRGNHHFKDLLTTQAHLHVLQAMARRNPRVLQAAPMYNHIRLWSAAHPGGHLHASGRSLRLPLLANMVRRVQSEGQE